MTKWIIIDFDCNEGCNNPEYNPGCNESSIRIKINAEMNDKFNLFAKHMKMPCPRCHRVAYHKRNASWDAVTNKDKLEDYNGSTFTPAEIQDYTAQMLEAKWMELTDDIKGHKYSIGKLKDVLEALKKTKYVSE